MNLLLAEMSHDFNTTEVGEERVLATQDDDGTDDLQIITLSSLRQPIDSRASYRVRLRAGVLGTYRAVFYGLRITFDDPGPRNF